MHSLVQIVEPRRTGDADRDILAAHAVIYQCAKSPESYALFAQLCESMADVPDRERDLTAVYTRLAALARWRAALMVKMG
jgi:hypothetical protein